LLIEIAIQAAAAADQQRADHDADQEVAGGGEGLVAGLVGGVQLFGGCRPPGLRRAW
jgi:MFS superfamily sulfate permease-like transporter